MEENWLTTVHETTEMMHHNAVCLFILADQLVAVIPQCPIAGRIARIAETMKLQADKLQKDVHAKVDADAANSLAMSQSLLDTALVCLARKTEEQKIPQA